MKQLLLLFTAMVWLTACNDTEYAGTAESSDSDHAAIADRNAEETKLVFRAIQTGDVAGLDTLFTDDVIDHDAGPQGQDIVGKDSVIAMLGKIHTYFDNLKVEMVHHATSNDGQYHYATVKMTGKAKENPWGMPVGMDIDDTSVDLIKMRDGKAAEHWGFMSMKDMNEIMGSMAGGQTPPTTTPKDTTKK